MSVLIMVFIGLIIFALMEENYPGLVGMLLAFAALGVYFLVLN